MYQNRAFSIHQRLTGRFRRLFRRKAANTYQHATELSYLHDNDRHFDINALISMR